MSYGEEGKKKKKTPPRSEQDKQIRRARSKLTARQREFCENYVRNPDCFGNGTVAYAQTYRINLLEPGAYQTAAAAASRLLRNVKLCDYIRAMLDKASLNELNADRNLAFVMNQFDDLGAKLRAIGEFNKLRGRITHKHKMAAVINVQRVSFGVPATTDSEEDEDEE